MALEIERKFIMSGFPKGLKLIREADIRQGYLSLEPEVRIHGAKDKNTGVENFRITIKGEGNLTRTEIRTSVEKAFYQEAVKILGKPMIQKSFRSYEWEGHVLEVCHVDAGLPGEFYYGEIEFDSEEEAKVFQKPDFLGVEVTGDDNYKMKNYWKRTRIEKSNM